ncbi:MAG: sulfur carrier protein ThiS [Planctomycetes bacterium]|nr:sulfur carrier protein ThiS [Planctomycetota bacterium]
MKIQLNGDGREVAFGITLAGLLEELELESRNVAIEVNLDVVPRARHAEHVLNDGDQVEIVTLVGGG